MIGALILLAEVSSIFFLIGFVCGERSEEKFQEKMESIRRGASK